MTDGDEASSLAVGSKVASITSYVVIGKLVNFFFLGLALVLVTRLLGPTQYGIYTLAIAFVSIFGQLGYAGIGTALSKFIPEFKQQKKHDEVNHIVSNALFMVIVAGIVLTAISFSLSGVLSLYIFHTASLYYIVQLASLWIFTSMLFGVFYDALVGFRNGKHIALLLTAQAIFQSTISIFFAIENYGAAAPILGLVIGYVFASVIGVWAVFRVNRLSYKMPSMQYIKKLLYFSVPVAISNILSGVVGSMALIFLGYIIASHINSLTSLSVVGNVGATSKASSLMSLVFDSLGFAILPMFSAILASKALNKEAGRIYSYTIYLAVLIVSPLLFYVAVFSTPFSNVVFGSSYALTPEYIPFACAGLLVGIAGTYAISLLTGSGRVKMVLKYNAIAYGIAVVLYLLLIPMAGGTGYVLVTFLLLPLVIDVLFINKLRTLFKIEFRIGKMSRIIVANLLTAALAALLYLYFSGLVLLIIAAVIYAMVYPVVALLLRGADKADIKTLKSLSSEVPLIGSLLGIFLDYASMVVS